MREPRKTDHVWAYKRQGSHVTVHDPIFISDIDGWITRCERVVHEGDHRWLWIQYQTLNPSYVGLCARCWK